MSESVTHGDSTIAAPEFDFDDDLQALRTLVREFCREFSPHPVVRADMESPTGFNPELWRRLGTELGVLGLACPPEYGGAGAGVVAMAVALEELGAALVCGPVVGTAMLAIPALCALHDYTIKNRYLPPVVRGESVAAVAAPLWNGGFDPDNVTVTAVRDVPGQWVLHGHVDHVPDGLTADLILVAARTAAGAALFAVAGDRVKRCALATLDLTRRQATLHFDDVVAELIADETEAPAICEHAAIVGAVLMAAGQVGGSQQILDRTVDYVTHRLQFGQPIGSYQAVKHRCADMLADVEYARSAAYHAAWALQDGSDGPRLVASLAKAVASECYCRVASAAIQLHGGIGFTWEGYAHLYLKRATNDSLMLGSAEQHLERIAQFALDDLSDSP